MDNLDKAPKDNFQFYFPVELDKAKDDSWKIKGIASTADKDDQGEIVMQGGLDISHLEKGLGLLNNDHKRGPHNILGQITNAKKSSEGLKIEGYLFKHQEEAKSYRNIMRSLEKGQEKRVKLSIEGKVLKRSKNKILRAKVTNIALTMSPINTNTYAEFMKSFGADVDDSFNENSVPCESGVSSSTSDSQILIDKGKLEVLVDMAKAGLATGNYDATPSSLTQGAALAKESLDKKKKKLKREYKSHIQYALNKFEKSYPDISKENKVLFIKKMYDIVSKDEQRCI